MLQLLVLEARGNLLRASHLRFWRIDLFILSTRAGEFKSTLKSQHHHHCHLMQ